MAIDIASWTDSQPPAEIEALQLEGSWLESQGQPPLRDWPDLGPFFNLRRLHLAGNELTEVAPGPLLMHLMVLDLGENQLEATPGLRSFPSLQTLDLSHNLLSEVPELAQLPGLSSLNLAHNGLTALPDLSHNRALRWLALSGNRRIKDLAALTGLEQLAQLFIKQLRIEDLQPLADLPALEALYLTPVTPDSLKVLRYHPQLELLHLSVNLLGEAWEMPPLHRLSTLVLAQGQNPDIRGLQRLRGLTSLRLDGNQLEAWPTWEDLPYLVHLSARRNPLRELPDLSGLPRLRRLDLRETDIPYQAIAEAQARHTQVEFLFEEE